MIRKTCFLDLDGVLADFVGGICRVFDITREQLYERWPEGDWSVYKALQISEDQFWTDIDAWGIRFWRELQPLSDYRQILETVEERFGAKNVAILTSPPRNPLAVAGKVEWIQTHLPDYRRRFFVGPDKQLLAHANAVLVDDYDENIRKFREAGGQAVLCPRRWNSGWRTDESAKCLRSVFDLVLRGHDLCR
jgi:5'(3')-deoxyribonucleotidase